MPLQAVGALVNLGLNSNVSQIMYNAISRLGNDAKCARSITGNCHAKCYYSTTAKISDSPIFIQVWWKQRHHSPRFLVGKYALDLNVLLHRNIVVNVPGRPGEVAIRFERYSNGVIEITSGQGRRGIRIGDFL